MTKIIENKFNKVTQCLYTEKGKTLLEYLKNTYIKTYPTHVK
jgi:hypothetical protein